jgi:tetratricopeptide (TPR) repeat protein
MPDRPNQQPHPAVTRLAGRAAWRLTCRGVLAALCVYATIAAAAALVVAIVASLSGQPPMPWGWIATVLGAGVLVAAAMRWITAKVSLIRAAIVLDERLRLHDALSTAMAFSTRGDDPLAAGHQEVAANHARSPDIRRALPLAVPIGIPRRWWWPVSVAALATSIAVLPPMVGEGRAATGLPPAAMSEAQLDTDEAIATMQEALDASPELQAAMEGAFDLKRHAELNSPAELRRETLRDLTELNRRLEAFQVGDQQRQLKRTRERLSKIDQSKDATSRLRRAMAAGDMEATAKAMQRLGEAGAEGSDARAAALEALAQDLASAAARDEAFEQALKDAGLSDADGIEDAEHLSEAQKEELRKQLMDALAATEMLDQLAKECKNCASQCKNPGGAAPSQGASASKKLAESDRACKQAGACQSACKSGLSKAGQSLASRPGSARQQGGRGPRPVEDDPAASTTAARSRSNVDATSKVLATSSVSGPLTRGTVSAPSSSPIQSARRRVERGLDVQRIPRRYREAVAAWFAATGDVAEAAEADAEQEAPSEEPAEASESP